jgi:hypothetical protein
MARHWRCWHPKLNKNDYMPVRPRTVSFSHQISSNFEPPAKIIKAEDSNPNVEQNELPSLAPSALNYLSTSVPNISKVLGSNKNLVIIKCEEAGDKCIKEEMKEESISPTTHNPQVMDGKFVCGFANCNYMSKYNSNMWRHQRKYNHFDSENRTL